MGFLNSSVVCKIEYERIVFFFYTAQEERENDQRKRGNVSK